jgi:hypothetical protein
MAWTSSYRVGSHAPPKRSVCAIGHRSRRSSQISNARSLYSGSVCEKSVVQSDTGPVTISLHVPSASCSTCRSRKSSVNLSSTVIVAPSPADSESCGRATRWPGLNPAIEM